MITKRFNIERENLYASSMLYIPGQFVKKVEHNLLNSVWNGKPSKVNTSTMISDPMPPS